MVRPIAVLLLLLVGCSSAVGSTSARGYALADLTISRGGRPLLVLEVELAETREEKRAGLMHVRHLPDTSGMAFINQAPSRGAFFMKNTLIPLDIAFWDEGGRIIEILQMEPCRADPCPLYEPQGPYVGALEVNRGLLDNRGARPGDLVSVTRRAAPAYRDSAYRSPGLPASPAVPGPPA